MRTYIDFLVKQGVTHFFFAPGSRSTPLAVAASHHPHVHLHRHFDERGLGFYAAGFVLGKEAPAAVITTSGTAVGNLLPAVMEAHHASVPLILLTADRPPELRDVSANQTSDQIKIFQNFVRFQCELDLTMPEQAIRTKIAEAVFRSQHPHPGPVHINCPFREPLYPMHDVYPNGQPILLETAPFAALPAQELPPNGIIMIGRLPKRSDLIPILRLASELKWPIFADLLSSARASLTPEQILHFEYLLDRAPKVDTVLHFGERFTSKRLLEWLKATPPSTYIHISSHTNWNDPFHLITKRIYATLNALSFHSKTNEEWLATWQALDRAFDQWLNKQTLPFTETAMMQMLSEANLENWGIFLANSMPIREAEWFLFPKRPFAFFANRGLSGIDGNIATIAGLTRAIEKPCLGIVGDLTALHDINSLPLLHGLPVVLIISNNDGCAIFSHLAVSLDPHFETICGFPHGYTFEDMAKAFRIPYTSADSHETFASKLEAALQGPKPCILEVKTSRAINIALHQHLKKAFAECQHEQLPLDYRT